MFNAELSVFLKGEIEAAALVRRLGLLLEASPTGTVNCLKARQRSEVK